MTIVYKKSRIFKKKTIIILLFIISCLTYLRIIRNEIHNIPIAFSLNNKYVYPLIVLLTSILYNSSSSTFYIFYLLLSPDLEEINIKKIMMLRKKYPNCEIKLLHMNEKYSEYMSGSYNSSAVYYRLELSNLITEFNKIIYLDIDTMVHKDLTQLYNIDMGKNYYMGFPGHDLTFYNINGTRNFINSGVMLVIVNILIKIRIELLFLKIFFYIENIIINKDNLKKLREVNATMMFRDY